MSWGEVSWPGPDKICNVVSEKALPLLWNLLVPHAKRFWGSSGSSSSANTVTDLLLSMYYCSRQLSAYGSNQNMRYMFLQIVSSHDPLNMRWLLMKLMHYSLYCLYNACPSSTCLIGSYHTSMFKSLFSLADVVLPLLCYRWFKNYVFSLKYSYIISPFSFPSSNSFIVHLHIFSNYCRFSCYFYTPTMHICVNL